MLACLTHHALKESILDLFITGYRPINLFINLNFRFSKFPNPKIYSMFFCKTIYFFINDDSFKPVWHILRDKSCFDIC